MKIDVKEGGNYRVITFSPSGVQKLKNSIVMLCKQMRTDIKEGKYTKS